MCDRYGGRLREEMVLEFSPGAERKEDKCNSPPVILIIFGDHGLIPETDKRSPNLTAMADHNESWDSGETTPFLDKSHITHTTHKTKDCLNEAPIVIHLNAGPVEEKK